MIKHLNRKKQIVLNIEKEAIAKSKGEKPEKKLDSMPLIEEEEDNLITYREYIKALKNLKKLYKKFLPRTIGFKEVLLCKRSEEEFEISESHADDFAMFRYELNFIYQNHQYKNEKPSELYGGKFPLSKTRLGMQIKDLPYKEQIDDQNIDKFRPPGLFRVRKAASV